MGLILLIGVGVGEAFTLAKAFALAKAYGRQSPLVPRIRSRVKIQSED